MTTLLSRNDAKQLSACPATAQYTGASGSAVGKGVAVKTFLEGDEAELIERIKGGDVEAFYELVRPYEPAVYFAAIGVLDNPADAEEVAQEAVLKAFSALSVFRSESKFSTWLIQITINEARMRLRKDSRYLYESIDEQKEEEDGAYFPKDFADWRDIPSEELQRGSCGKRSSVRWLLWMGSIGRYWYLGMSST